MGNFGFFTITFLIDNPDSWVWKYVPDIEAKVKAAGFKSRVITSYKEFRKNDLVFFLSCITIVPKEFLSKAKLCIVIHASELPKGRGSAPVQWQVLEGKKRIPLIMFKCEEKVDAGKIFIQDYFNLDGGELVDEIRDKEFSKITNIILRFVKNPDKFISGAKEQTGSPSYYPRRMPKDSELNISSSIKSQFNLFRVSDNERYPVFFVYNCKKYILKITKGGKGKVVDFHLGNPSLSDCIQGEGTGTDKYRKKISQLRVD